MTQENELEPRTQPDALAAIAEATGEAPPAAPEPVPEPETPAAPDPEPALINVKVQIPVATNDQLKALAALYGKTKQETATNMLIGFTQKQYSVNKAHGRI